MNNQNTETRLGMKWHYCYNAILAIISSILILYLTFENIFDYFNDESIWFYLIGGVVLGVSLTSLFKKNKTAYILIIILNSLIHIVCVCVSVNSVWLIIEDLVSHSDWFDGLGVAIGMFLLFCSIPLWFITIINFIYYKKRKSIFY